MFGLTATELRLAFYGVLLAAISSWLLYEHHHLIAEGESRIKALDTAARIAQKAEDEKTSAGVVHDLNQRLADALQPAPAPSLRLCVSPRSVRAGQAPSGTQPSVVSASGTGPSGVPEGTAGIDIGGPVQDVKRASEVIAIYRDTTWDWAVRQSATH